MTKSQLVTHIAHMNPTVPADRVEKVLDDILDTIAGELAQGNKVLISGFGRFEMRERSQKRFINPKTGQHSILAVRSRPVFKASKRLEDEILVRQ